MEMIELSTVVMAYTGTLLFAVAWFLLPPWLLGPRAMLAEQTRLEWKQKEGTEHSQQYTPRRRMAYGLGNKGR